MSSKELLRALLIFIVAAAVLAASAFALESAFPNVPPLEVVETPEPTPEPEPEPEYVCPLELKTGNVTHKRYISGYENGTFRPDKTMTRAEAAVMIYGLLKEVPEERAAFDDVSPEDWYYDAIGVLAAAGIIVDEDELAEPMEEISRGEFVAMLSRFFPKSEAECDFADVSPDSPWYEHIAKACQLGWIDGYDDGLFYPYRTISRAEAATVINNVLGRSADESYADGIILPLFEDVSPEHWAYYDIMEASLTHSPTMIHGIDESWHTVDTEPLSRPVGVLYEGQDYYYIAENGLPVSDTYVGSLYFGPDGLYTSGDEEIDQYTKELLAGIVTEDMTQEERLRAAYDYVRDNYTYLRRNYYDKGETGWELEDARVMFRTKRGNCYNYTAAFWALARQLGYDARVVSGGVGWSERPHGWVEIDGTDGIAYIYDTELEMSYRKKGTYYYNFFHMSYDSVPWPYTK